MKKRRIMALLLACVMAVGVMATGCGQQEKESKESTVSQTGEAESTSTQEVEELEPYTVVWWMRGDESKDHDKVMEAVNARIAELLPNTTLEVVWIANSEYKDRWNKAMASGEKIDIGWSASWVNKPQTDVENGVLYAVDDLLEEYGQGIIEAVGGWDVLDMNRIEGEMYHILAWQGLGRNRKVLYMNKKLADAMPEGWLESAQKVFLENQEYTIEDHAAILAKLEEALIVNKEQNICPDGLKKGTPGDILTWDREYSDNYRVQVTEKDGVYTVVDWFNNPVAAAFYDVLAEWKEKGYYPEDALLRDNNATMTETQAFVLGEGIADNYAATKSASLGFEVVGCLATPTNELTTGFSTGVVLPASGENPERSMQLLNLVYTDAELYQLLVYGIEGVHYVKNSNGTITRPASGERDYEGATNWTLGTCMNSLPESEAAIGNYEALYAVEAEAEIPSLIGFSFNADEYGVKSQQTNISATIAEYDFWYCADQPEARYAEFCKKLEEVGMDEYLAAFKQALSKYVTENNLGTVAP